LEKQKLEQRQLKLVQIQKQYPSYLIVKALPKWVMPKVDLPAELRKAEQVTALSHPRWVKCFYHTYQFKAILEGGRGLKVLRTDPLLPGESNN